MKKYILILFLMLCGGVVQAAEPDFSLIGSKSSTASVSKKDLDIELPVFVGGGVSVGEIRSTKPAGEGWQWDKNKKEWWRYVPNCPTERGG